MGKAARAAYWIGGVGLTVAARWVMSNSERFQAWAGHVFGSRGADVVRSLRLALGVEALLGILPMLAGALLLALALGWPPRPPSRSVPATTTRPGWVGWAWMLGAVALAVAELWLLTRPTPGTAAVVVWVCAPLVAWVAAVVFDRARGTPLGDPFPQRGELRALAAAVVLVILLVGHDAGSWRWSGLPDEAHFFQAALAIVDGRNVTFRLSESGVFGYHPVLSSCYQAVFLWLFGSDAFAWRLSSVTAFALAVPFVYLLGRELHGRRVGWIAAALFASAPLAVGFAHLGYNNAQVYAPVAAALALFAYAHRRRSAVGYLLSGIAVGLCFFTFFTARLAVFLIPLLAWSRGPTARLWHDRRAVMFLVFGFAVTALPILLQSGESLERMFVAAGLGRDPLVASVGAGDADLLAAVGARVRRALGHWLVATFYGVYTQNSHLQTRPVLDLFTVSLSTVGVVLGASGLLAGRRDFLAPAYLLSTFWVGTLSSYGEPPLTRLMFLAPLSALLAAATLNQALGRLAAAVGTRAASAAGAAVVAVAVVWNAALLQYSLRYRYHGYAEGTGAELIRASQMFPPETWLVVLLPPFSSAATGLREVVEPYGLARRLTIKVSPQPEIPANLAAPLVVFHAFPDNDETRAFEQALQARLAPSVWSDTNPGPRGNLRYLYAPSESPREAAPPQVSSRREP